MIRLLELFGGIGACSAALDRLGIDYEIADYVEIDKYAVKSYNAIHGTNFEPQDIQKWDKDINIDLIMHGSPCQDFSIAGYNRGGDKGSGTRSSLMYETIRIVSKLKPKYVIWENVKNLLSEKHRHNFDAYLQTMTELGYTNYYQVLNAKDYEIPQNRERVFTISIRNDLNVNFYFPEKKTLEKRLRDILENNVDDKYFVDEKYKSISFIDQNYIMLNGGVIGKMHDISRRAYNVNYISPTIHTCGGGNREPKVVIDCFPKLIGGFGDKKSNNGTQYYQQDRVYSSDSVAMCHPANLPQGSYKYLVGDNPLRIRKLTPKECWRLMGFSDEDFSKAEKVNSNTQLYKQAGNSIVVDVLVAIFEHLFSEKDFNQSGTQITFDDLL